MKDIEQDNRPKLLQLFKELAEVQANNMRLEAAIFVKEAKKQVDKKAKDFAQLIKESAINFGKRAQDLAGDLIKDYNAGKQGKENIISRYEQSLKTINEEYTSQFGDTLIEKQFCEEQEMECTRKIALLKHKRREMKKTKMHREDVAHARDIKRQLKKAAKEGDFDYAQKLFDQYREIQERSPVTIISREIEEAEQSRKAWKKRIGIINKALKDCKEGRNAEIIDAVAEKSVDLVYAGNTTPIRRFLGSVLNRINGLNKFKNIVLKKMEDKVNQIETERIPEVKEKIQMRKEQLQQRGKEIEDKAKERMDAGRQKATEIKDSVVEAGKNKVEQGKEQIKKVTDRGKESLNKIIQKGRDRKEQLIITMEKKIEESKEREAELQDKIEYKGRHFKKVVETEETTVEAENSEETLKVDDEQVEVLEEPIVEIEDGEEDLEVDDEQVEVVYGEDGKEIDEEKEEIEESVEDERVEDDEEER